MKTLLLLILLIPLSSAMNISVDYPSRMEIGVETEFKVEVLEPRGKFYDIKIDIIQNNQRISKIIDSGKAKSSMYYINDAIEKKGSFYLLVNAAEPEGAEVIFKIREQNGKTYTFSDYEIIMEREVVIKSVRREPKEDSRKSKQNTRDLRTNKDKLVEDLNEVIIVPKEKPLKAISLNPKTIKTDKNFEKGKVEFGKYLFLIFSIVLLILYIIKPKEKKNEFRY